MLLTPTAIPERTPEQLHQMGIDIVIHANVVIRSLVHAVRTVLARVREGVCLAEMDSEVATMAAILELTHGELEHKARPVLQEARDR